MRRRQESPRVTQSAIIIFYLGADCVTIGVDQHGVDELVLAVLVSLQSWCPNDDWKCQLKIIRAPEECNARH